MIRAGVTIGVASGDDGNNTDYVTKSTSSWRASSKWALSVGGTVVGLTQDGTRQWDTGWTDTLYVHDQGEWLRIRPAQAPPDDVRATALAVLPQVHAPVGRHGGSLSWW